jgi:signal transduction histidine kinase
MGYRDVMGTSAPPADSRDDDRRELHRLVEEQAALRRVAMLVAAGAPPAEVFEAVSAEVAALIAADGSVLSRYEADGTVTALSGWTTEGGFSNLGTRYALEGTLSGLILETGRPGRVDNYAQAPGEAREAAREMGVHSSVGAPITVEGRHWGVLAAASKSEQPLPRDTEQRLAEFAELFATAIANSEAHEQLAQLADEQAALRRVATLVAEGAPSPDVLAAVVEEVGRLLPFTSAAVGRFEPDDMVTTVAAWSSSGEVAFAAEKRWPTEGQHVTGIVFRTGRSARLDDFSDASGPIGLNAREAGYRSVVGSPITVEGRLWGVMTAASTAEDPLPANTEGRLASFTELLATLFSKVESREAVERLAQEQAALRRVATLVAEGATPHRVFDAVQHEVVRMFNAPLSVLMRYDDANGTATLLATDDGFLGPIGRSWSVEGDDSAIARVCRTGLPARSEDIRLRQGPISDVGRSVGARSAVAVPIVVDGTLWGVMSVGSRETEPLSADFEGRLAKFTELLATAIANAEGRAEVDASRARIVATADATRRQIERDLHDGAQQQLVSLALALRAAQATVPEELEQHRSELGRVVDGLTAALDDLREIALGIHPAGLSEDGLTPALKRLVARSPLRVNLDVRADGRFPEPVEVTAYYVVSESLTNAAKYADAPVVDVAVAADGGALRVEVRDDGRGGADPAEGSGLLGLRDRAEAIGGTMRLTSPPGAGTSVRVELPLADQAARR